MSIFALPPVVVIASGFLPLVGFIFLYLYLLYKRSYLFGENLLISLVIWGSFVSLLTEILSALHAISFYPFLFAWLIIDIILLAGIGKDFRYLRIKENITLKIDIVSGAIILIIATLLAIALISPPNNWDSMSYHMARVEHWIQNGNLTFYPTNIIRQLYQGSWSEYAILNFQVLNQSDRFANLIQWIAMLGSVVCSSLIVNILGGNRKAQQLAAVFVVSIPMGILQSTSTQTDYVVSFWSICCVYFLLKAKSENANENIIYASLSSGLAIATKPTSLIFISPFILWIGISMLRRKPSFEFISIVTCVVLIVILNIGQFSRNTSLFGQPYGSGSHKYTNETISLGALISNMIRHIDLQVASVEPIDSQIVLRTLEIHRLLKLDVVDPKTTMATGFRVYEADANEDIATYTIHFLLLTVVLVQSLFFVKDKRIIIYAISIIGTFLLFNLVLKWQAFNNRLFLPMYVIAAPLFGLFLSKIVHLFPSKFLIVVLFISSIPFILFNVRRPLVSPDTVLLLPRNDIYFLYRPELKQTFFFYSEYIKNSACKQIGLQVDEDNWEYPLWVYLGGTRSFDYRIEHINVTNVSQSLTYPRGDFFPCLILGNTEIGEKIQYLGYSYYRKFKSDYLSLYEGVIR